MAWLSQNWPYLVLLLGFVALLAWRKRTGCAMGHQHGRPESGAPGAIDNTVAHGDTHSSAAKHGKSDRQGGGGGHGCC